MPAPVHSIEPTQRSASALSSPAKPMRTFAPSQALFPFVRRFEVIETSAETTRTLLPDTGLVVGFRYAGQATLLEAESPLVVPDNSVAGLRSTARRMMTSAGGGLVVAKLREACAGRFFAGPLHELFGQTLSLDDLAHPREVARASSRIREAHDDTERIATFEQFLLDVARPWHPDPVVLCVLRAIDAASGAIRVGALAKIAALSQDALEKRFRRAVGLTPKQYALIIRLRRAVDSYAHGGSLTQISFDAGYSDQSHFIRQFRQVTGEAPRRLLSAQEYC